ncbi:MAG: hypothetical protein NC417_06815 [Candidatus Gastranaerophilales bacterium]|nr:hypothetical protein [Candidatus Gastranaerophilales bacterium]
MINLLRMDLYRVKRSKAFYVCLAILAGIVLLCYGMLYLMGTPDGQRVAVKIGMATLSEVVEGTEILEGVDTLEMFRESFMDGGMYCVVLGTLMVLFVCMDYHSGYMKNIMTLHRKRWKYIVSVLITAGIVNFCYLAFNYAWSLLLNVLFRHMVPVSGLGDTLFYMGWAWLLTTAFAALTVMVCVLTKSAVAGVMTVVLFGSGVVVVALSSIMNLFHAGGWAKYTIYFSLSDGSASFSSAKDLEPYVLGLIFVGVYSLVAAWSITKQDI